MQATYVKKEIISQLWKIKLEKVKIMTNFIETFTNDQKLLQNIRSKC